jgi:hypothetical protein
VPSDDVRYAATDVARGVWKAPAGFQAITNNVTGVTARGAMTDNRQGTLNPLGVNCLRAFPNLPTIVFGARTLATTEQQWTYVPVLRMALFLEQTLLANLKWVLFEPNAEPLWSAITMSINAFMLGLFKQGAFQGKKPSEAFLVKPSDCLGHLRPARAIPIGASSRHSTHPNPLRGLVTASCRAAKQPRQANKHNSSSLPRFSLQRRRIHG